MQSVAAIYAVFVAIFALSLQHNKKNISLAADVLKPPFKNVSCNIVVIMYFNGLILLILSFYNPLELKIKILLFGSLVSLLISLVVIMNSSFHILTNVAGLITNDEKFTMIEDCIQDPRAFDPLIQMLNDDNENVREAAVSALGQRKDPRAFDPLTQMLYDSSSNVRETAVSALGQSKDPRAVGLLIQMLDDPEVNVKESAIFALCQSGDSRVVDPLFRIFNDPDTNTYIRKYSEEALERLGRLNKNTK
ncbi:HEAT repeat domain-containing protein [Methanosarcina sp. WWM596]|uniref:HEAT repeat domain-containing protein n=1 Tax=Methanosarcina sp. WWM596 TaxID=1434103 RepID=UPI001E62678F|nr:HEAT repeat domain-containing protein [Methanosarcina sp. WWM596]